MNFDAGVEQYTKRATEDLKKVFRTVALDLHSTIVKETPHDTGRLKANNQIGIREAPAFSLNDTDTGGGATIAEGRRQLEAFQLGDTIYIVNNLEYAVPVEFIGSRMGPNSTAKKPQGFWRISVQNIKTKYPFLRSA